MSTELLYFTLRKIFTLGKLALGRAQGISGGRRYVGDVAFGTNALAKFTLGNVAVWTIALRLAGEFFVVMAWTLLPGG